MYQTIKNKLLSNNSSSNVEQSNATNVNTKLLLEVRAIEARDLMIADTNGFSDPYLKLSIRSEKAPRKIKSYKTKYIRKTLNPLWNESFILELEDPETDFLQIECWDKDFLKPDDPLGYIYLKLDKLEQGVEQVYWLKLVNADHGDVHVAIKSLNFSSLRTSECSSSNIPLMPPVMQHSQMYAAAPPVFMSSNHAFTPIPQQLSLQQMPTQFISSPQISVPSPLIQSNSDASSLYQTATLQGFDLNYSQIKFISRIGSGAFGEVWKGEWAGTTVAIKKILKTDISDDDLKEFSNEILLMSKLRHPNIVQFLGACFNPEFCLVTEFMERGSLYDILADSNIELKWDVRIQIAFDIAKGMLYLHTRTPPIIHRDIKSLNILVTKDWKATISDFGLTRIKDKALNSDSKVGSPAWSAPEVLRSEEYNETADVYSYGIVLWELITRKTPYEDLSNPMQLIGQVAYNKPSLRPTIPDDCPVPELVKLMIECWNDEADKRPPFSVIIEELKKLSKEYD